MYKLYDFLPSGNGYKVRLLLTQLQIPFTRIELNIAESNAILYYLSQGTEYFSQDKYQKAQIMQWLFFEQYSHEPNIATPRFWISILQQPEKQQKEIEQKRKLGYVALNVMENHLKSHDFLVAERYTIADIALYAYTHVAEEGGFNLTEFSAILDWLGRIQAQPKHIRIKERALK